MSTNMLVLFVRLAVVLVAGLAVVACGDDATSGTTTTAESSSSTTTPTATEPTTTDSPTTAESTTTTESTNSAQTAIEVSFATGDGSDCGEVTAFIRMIDDDVDPVTAAFSVLVAGPNDEETTAGASSFFSAATTDVVSSVVNNDGLLVVDFSNIDTLIPNASTSCGSESLLAQLNATAFQFDSVDRTRYLIDGSCERFAGWLQFDCFDTDRDGQQIFVPVQEQASGSGCTPPTADTLPDGRWFGFIDGAEDQQLAFDLACWFTGSAATTAAAEDGEESPPPNDYHIRNTNDAVRTLPVDPATNVLWLPNPGDPASATTAGYASWRDDRVDRSHQPGVWLTIERGNIVAIEEQYVP